MDALDPGCRAIHPGEPGLSDLPRLFERDSSSDLATAIDRVGQSLSQKGSRNQAGAEPQRPGSMVHVPAYQSGVSEKGAGRLT